MSNPTGAKGRIEANMRSWSDLPPDLVDLIASRLGFVDQIRCSSVCKSWYSALTPIRVPEPKKRPWPMLAYLPNNFKGVFEFFDPILGKVDVSGFQKAVDGCLTFRSIKDAWAIVTDDDGYHTQIFMADIFSLKDKFINLVLMGPYRFDGICFSSPPTDSNCVAMGIRGSINDSEVHISLWRPGQDSWSVQKKYENNNPFIFFVGSSNPIFRKGLFYCLGKNGNLGIFDPNIEEWTVLDKPKATHRVESLSGDDLEWNLVIRSEECCYLVESFKGHLLSIFDYNNGKPLLVMKLDESKMAWTKVEDLDNEVIFLDTSNSISIPAPSKRLKNRIYFTRFLCDNGKPIEGVYYCLKSKKYNNNPKYEVREKAHRTWIMSRTSTLYYN